jgi:VWFA-related protein
MISRVLSLILSIWLASLVAAQEATPEPTPPDEPLKISTEEVQLNVVAQNTKGHFDPTLVKDDLLIVEDGVPQEIASLRRTPASVLLLLDTGGDLQFVKNPAATRLTAEILLRTLPLDNSFSVVQYHDKVETISDWTNDLDQISAALKSKLFSGKRSRFVTALNAAVEMFKSRPPENRHIVLISDGLESIADDSARRKAFQNLLAANITVHVISYTQLEEQSAQKTSQRVKIGGEGMKPRLPQWIVDTIAQTLPDDQTNDSPRKVFRAMNTAPKLIVIELDNQWIKAIRQKREAWRKSETELQALASETGGLFDAPENQETMWVRAREVANAIGSQYVVTYIPKRAIGESSTEQTRQVRVVSRRVGLQVRSKEKIFVSNSNL